MLASAVPRDAVDEAIEATGKAAKRSGGKLPPHVMVYFAMVRALFADDEEVAARLTETLRGWDCWDEAWEVPTSGGITQARQRLGYEPLRELFSQVAAPGRRRADHRLETEEVTGSIPVSPTMLVQVRGQFP